MKTFKVLFFLFVWIHSAITFAQGLDSIQTRIEKSFLQFGRTGNKREVEAVISELQALKTAKGKQGSSYINYWLGFAFYRYSIVQALNDEKQAESLIETGIDIIEEIGQKNSEHYALLSLMKGFALQFANPLSLPIAAPKVGELAEKSITLNPKNPRAHLALATYDFYTPSMFGGGKITEEELLKSIELPQRFDANPYASSWGLRDSYRLLISFYQNKKVQERAANYSQIMIDSGFQEAVAYRNILDYYFSKGNEEQVEKYSLAALSNLNSSEKVFFYKYIINHFIRVDNMVKTRSYCIEAIESYPNLLPWIKERPQKFPQQSDKLQFVNDLK